MTRIEFNLAKYDIGGKDAIAGDGKLTGEEVDLATKDGWHVFDFGNLNLVTRQSKLDKMSIWAEKVQEQERKNWENTAKDLGILATKDELPPINYPLQF